MYLAVCKSMAQMARASEVGPISLFLISRERTSVDETLQCSERKRFTSTDAATRGCDSSKLARIGGGVEALMFARSLPKSAGF